MNEHKDILKSVQARVEYSVWAYDDADIEPTGYPGRISVYDTKPDIIDARRADPKYDHIIIVVTQIQQPKLHSDDALEILRLLEIEEQEMEDYVESPGD